jgi:predicted dehydrogenase
MMAALARDRKRILAVNLIMRYNPLCAAVKALVNSRLLGMPLHATFINAAQDETLGPEHWFWDRAQSGGIFVEHGVHFFDLFEWWFGPGEVISAVQLQRPGSRAVDQVQCCVHYPPATLGTFYHGFTQMLRRDAQHWRILFETGTLTMKEWVPTTLRLDWHGTEAGAKQLRTIFPGSEMEILESYDGKERDSVSRHSPRSVEKHFRLRANTGHSKMKLYGVMLRGLMTDQLEAMRASGHSRLVSESNGVTSLMYALAAQEMADDKA